MNIDFGVSAIINNDFDKFKQYVDQPTADIESMITYTCWFDRLTMLKYIISFYKHFTTPTCFVNKSIAKFLLHIPTVNPADIKTINQDIILTYYPDD